MKVPNIEELQAWYNYNLDIKNRVIYFGAWQPNEEISVEDKSWEVSDWSAQNIIKGLTVLNRLSDEPINIIWLSYGGDWCAGMAIYDYIGNCKSHITMTCYGRVRSMGTIILQACDNRVLSPNCEFMIHYGNFFVDAVHSKDALSIAQEESRNNDTMEEIYLGSIKRVHPRYSRSKVKEMMKYDKYMTPKEAIELGLADEVIK